MAVNIFVELSVIMGVALLVAGLMRMLKQPVIIGYILAGLVIASLGIMTSKDAIAGFAEMGLVLLLFMVGLGLNPKIIKSVGKVSILTGLGQVIFTFVISYIISYLLGYTILVSAFIAIGLTFSSTIIIMKLLSDKGDVESLYGRISIGVLIVQDLVAAFILMVLASLSGAQGSLQSIIISTVLKGVGLIIILWAISITIFPWLTKRIARNQEILLLFSLAWAMIVATVFLQLGFSLEIGALLAGVALSMSPYRHEISSKLKPLRDFFIALFFILLGTQLNIGEVTGYIIPLLVFSFFVLIGNPIIVMIIMGLLGYTKRTSFLTGLTVAQISEFSLILIALGIKNGYLTEELQGLFVLIALITIAGSTYFILYSNQLYKKLSPILTIFEKKGKKVDEHSYIKEEQYDIVLFGHNRVGYELLESFKKIKKKFLVVDYNPDIVTMLAKEGYDTKYGDASDLELLNDINLKQARMIVSTIPDIDTNLLLVKRIRTVSSKSIIIMISHQIDEAMQLYDAGATYVIMPHFLGGHHTSTMIEHYGLDVEKFLMEKVQHLEHLKTRKLKGHEHPWHQRG